jgi:Spy/CpxP family protein refolding chaperone
MKPVKFTVLASTAFFLLIAAFVSAQTSTTQPMGSMPQSMGKMSRLMESDSLQIEHHVAMMKENLSLSDTQAQQIRTILEKQDKQMMADREKYANDATAMQKARIDLRSSTQKEITSVLTKDQQTKYEQMGKKEMTKGRLRHKPDQNTNTQKGTTQYKAK